MSDLREAPAGSKLHHPGLSSAEVLDLVGLANASYNDFYDDSVSGWRAITDDLIGFGLDPSFLPFVADSTGLFRRQDAFFVDSETVFDGFRADAQATVYRRGDEPLIAIAFRGTESVLSDSEDWLDIGNHADEFDPLLTAIDSYAAANAISEIQITGHSLGGGVAEIIMDRRDDSLTVSYEAVAIASPRASTANDTRVLNIGHEGDAVYSIAGFRNSNAVDNLVAVFNDQGLFDVGIGEAFGAQHSVDAYENTVKTVLRSQFQSETNRDSLVIVNYTDQKEDLEDAVFEALIDSPAFVFGPPLILGRDTDITDFKDPTRILSADDWLIGSNGDDWLEGFGGDDTLQGDVGSLLSLGGNDTMAGGAGEDLFLGAPEDLNGDTIVDLEIGDRIGVSGATVDEETLRDEVGGDTTITFNGDSGFFDFFGTDVSINAVVPEGSILRLSEETLEDGGSIIEVVANNTLSFVQDFVVGTTQDTSFSYDLERTGDTSFPITVFVDGEVDTGNAFFTDFNYTFDPGPSPELVITASVAELFGDVAGPIEITLIPTGPESESVEILDGTADYLLIGDRVDDRGGTAFGDPHLLSFDNVAFDFQAAGEFVLARATSGPDYEVQARFVALSSAVSVTQAVATSVDGTTISLHTDGGEGLLEIDGTVTPLADGTAVSVGSGSVSRTGRTIEIDHGNGDFTVVDVFSSFLNVAPQPSLSRDPGTMEGLLGNANGTPADDFRLANGTVLTTPVPVETLYGDFAASWTLSEADSLLPGVREDYDAPDRIITIDSLPAALRATAEAAVDAQGITNPILREAAILDFALTGNNEFIEAAVLADQTFNPIVDTVPVDPVSNPVIVLTSDTNNLNEEDALTQTAILTVSRGNTEGDLTVNYAISGAGAAPADGADFVGGVVSGSVIIADGDETATFDVEVVDDDADEGPETFDVSIFLEPDEVDDFELLVSSVRLTVEDDDEAPALNEVAGTTGRDYLVGTEVDDVFLFKGGYGDAARGNGGNDQFDLAENAANRIDDNTRILDWSEGDMIVGIGLDDVHLETVRSSSTAIRFGYGEDNDVLTITGMIPNSIESLFGLDQIA